MELVTGNNVVPMAQYAGSNLHSANFNRSEVMMTTLQIAEVCDKEHKNVLVDVRNMLDSLKNLAAEKPAARFYEGIEQSSYKHRGKNLEMYVLDKRMTLALVSGYRLDLRLNMIDRIEQLEGDKRLAPQLSMDSIERLIEMKISESLRSIPGATVIIPTPHVSATLSTKRVRPSNLGHRLGISGNRLNKAMELSGLQTRAGTNWIPTSRASGLFEILKSHLTPKGRVTQILWSEEVLGQILPEHLTR